MNWFFWRKKQKTIIDDTLAYVGELFSELKPETALLVGLPLAFWTVKKATELIEKEKKDQKKKNWFLRIINRIKYDFFKFKF